MIKDIFKINSQVEHFHLILPKGYKKVLKIAAAEAAISMSELVRLVLDNHLIQRSNEDGSKTNEKDD